MESPTQTSVFLLGRFEVQIDGCTVVDRTWPRRRVQTLLKILSLNEQHALHREQVMEYLWPDKPAQDANNNLRQALYYLRSRLAQCDVDGELVALSNGVLSLPEGATFDTEQFGRLAQQVMTSSDPQLVEEALSTYGGDLLPDDLYEEWTWALREELKEVRHRLLFRLADMNAARGEADRAIEQLRELVRSDPANEQAHQQLMRIYAATSQREQALRQYQRLRESLEKELTIEPSAGSEELYRVILQRTPGDAEPAIAFPAALRPRSSSKFVGRVQEVARLREEWEHVRGGECRLIFIAGAAGIGKTRLAGEFASSVHAEGASVLFGRCDEEPLDSYQPFTQALRSYLSAPEVSGVAWALLKTRPALARLIPHAGLNETFASLQSKATDDVVEDGGGERLRFFDDVASILQEIAARPTVLFLDDLHWADKPALLLLRHLVRLEGRTPLLILGTFRDDEITRSHPLATLVADLRRDRTYDAIELKGLDRASVGALLSASGVERAPPGFIEAMIKKTQGNPFFLEETISHLAEAGALTAVDDRWRVLEQTIPQGVKDVLGQRLTRLSRECDRVLQIAAAGGSEFTLDLLHKVTGLQREPLLDALDEALQARVIAEDQDVPGRYAFAHDLIRSVLYEDMSKGRRARLHQLIGAALEASPEKSYAELAHHFLGAGTDADRAIRYSNLAGDQARSVLAYEDAVEHYQRSLEAMERRGDDDWELRCETLLSLGDAQARAGEKTMGLAAFERAAAIARERGSGALLARAALGRAGTWVGAGYGNPDTIALLEEASGKIPADDPALRVRLLSRLAVEMYYGDAPERRLSLSREAVEAAHALEDPRELANALNARYYAIWAPHSCEERLDIASEMLVLAQAADDKELILQAHHFRAFGFLELSDIPAAREEIRAYEVLAEELRQPIYLYRSAARRAMLAILEGRFADGERAVGEAFSISRSLGDSNANVEVGVQTLVLRREEGRLAEVLPTIEAFVANYPAIPGWEAAMAFASAEVGRLDDARARFDSFARDIFQRIPYDATWLASHCLLVEACVALGDLENAQRLYEVLEPHMADNCVIGPGSAFHGAVAHYLGMLAVLMSRWDDAAGHFALALERHTNMGARPWTARTQHELGRLLKARGVKKDAGRADQLLREASATAKALGMKSFAAVAD